MRNNNNGGLFSARSISNYMRIVSSGASTAASTIRSTISSIANNSNDDSNRDQVQWAGFDKLEFEPNIIHQVLLLAYKSGFQVWDVQKSDEVRQLASRHDGPVSFLQIQKSPNPNPNPNPSTSRKKDRFSESRPLLIVSSNGNGGSNSTGYELSQNLGGTEELGFIRFYSIKLNEYVHELKFRSAVYSIRCSSRVVAVSQASQIHCFNAGSLEREYTILTYPVAYPVPAPPAGTAGWGPLAVGPRWIAYSGSPIAVSDAGRVSPQILNLNSNTNPNHNPNSSSSNGSNGNSSIVAHYAKESGKQLANGIATLGDIGYKKLSKYYSEYVPRNGSSNGAAHNRMLSDSENAGTVIVRDLVTKQVVVQFRAHTSPISALSFDPSGTLLVTASIHGRNINVFRIMPGQAAATQSAAPDSAADPNGSYFHLYRLQRGITNAVIKDVSFSSDSEWIMISSSRGTSHLFSISPYPTPTPSPSDQSYSATSALLPDPADPRPPTLQPKSLSSPGPPVTLSVVSRIRSGPHTLKSTAVALAAGAPNPISGAIASAFHTDSKEYLLVFSPSGSIVQYLLRRTPYDYAENTRDNARFMVEAQRKWELCNKRNRRDHGENFDIYGDQVKGEINNHNNINTNSSKNISNNNNEESRNLYYISEIELQTHLVHVPLWARPGIQFHVMMGGTHSTEEGDYWSEMEGGGEVEIEREPSRMIEARSKDLIPVFDSLHILRFNPRVHTGDMNRNGQIIRHKSTLSEENGGRLSCRSSCSSLDCSINSESADPSSASASGIDVNNPNFRPKLDPHVNNSSSVNSNGAYGNGDLLLPDLL